jgi:predicted RNA binding protein YcfA (HicA-like mRNA interferase family)
VRLPRDLAGRELAALLRRHFDYQVLRQTGSHLRLATSMGGEHRITVPAGGPLRVGTLAAILSDVAEHQGITRADLEGRLFG